MHGHESLFLPIVKQSMTVTWNRNLNEFQKLAMSRILMIDCKAYGSAAMMLIQSAGGGKSMVSMTVGNVKCGVILIIESTQALSSDQVSKHVDVSRACGPADAFQLDTIKSQLDAEQLFNV